VTLSETHFESFGRDLDELRAEYLAKIGERDAEHIRSVRAIARALHASGRLLVHFSLDPASWSAGVLALGLYKVLENLEIGHNVMHGQYNFMGDPQLSSRNYEWDLVATARSWKRAHNATHHVFTNVIGRDVDFGYNAFRLSAEVPWKPSHLLQPLLSPLSGVFFEYAVATYDLGLGRPRREVAEDLWAFLKKAGRKVSVEYLLYPALAGPLALKVLAANALANVLRNLWAYVVIYCGHLAEDAATFREEDLAGEDRSRWYLRQVTGSGNFEVSGLGHVLSGHLGFQIEHHLFPNVPAWRYREMAPRVREICERHGVPYHTGPLGARFTSAMRRVLRFALPGVPRHRLAPRALPWNHAN
jgi:NADPH-dependent stearoyl-CoA 9-desaturase